MIIQNPVLNETVMLSKLNALFFSLIILLPLISCAPTEEVAAPEPEEVDEFQITEADYDRAASLMSWNLSDKVFRNSISPNWMDDDQFWYQVSARDGEIYYWVNPHDQTRERAFDHQRLADAIEAVLEQEQDPYDLPLNDLEIAPDRSSLSFVRDDDILTCHLENYECEITDEVPKSIPHSVDSPDGRYSAYIEDWNLWVYDHEKEERVQLTTEGEYRYGFASNSQGWFQADWPVLKWSDDGSRIATFRQDERNVPEMHLLEMQEGRPALESWPYALPGDDDDEVPMLERVVIDVENRDKTWLDVEPDHQRTSNCCGLTRGTDWADNQWNVDASRLAFVSTSRDYKTVTLRVADPETGEVETVYEETAETFFESNLTSRGIPNWRVLHDSNEFIWFTRKDEYGHLYLHDLETGELKNRITEGEWNVVDILHIDEEAREIIFTGAGKNPEHDPYHQHLYRVGFDGGEVEHLTKQEGNHQISLSPSGTYFTDTWSDFTTPQTIALRDRTGDEVLELEQADVELLYEETVWNAPESFTVKDRNDEYDLYGLMFKPSDFDPDKSYPIINHIYPGPQSGSIGSRSFTASRGVAQALAELGFIVVQIDALGSSPLRTKSFHTAYQGNMGDNGLPDQKAGMKQLAERYEWIDLERVGMFGHSGGGYATAAALFRHPDFFHVGVSSAGNHDNTGYTYYWGEKFQGLREETEDGDTYDNQGNPAVAKNLEGELLISYGTMDSNVHPNMTKQVIDELIEHNKDFDLIVMPNRGHGYAGEPYHIRRTWDHFVRHLLNTEPPEEYELR